MPARYRWFDRIVEFSKDEKATAVKDISPAEAFFADHFPRMPVVPGALQLEALLQLGKWLVDASNGFQVAAELQRVKGVDFRQLVRPGDRLLFEAEAISIRPDGATVKARATVNGRKVAGVKEINFAYLPLSSAQAAGEKGLFNLLSGQVS